ncbi:UDP-N-acetylmuramate--L-alanine ligase, partial [Patescibacteria group bacterium]|nr:UDP-N-acetylmuramate--L-alanine ligase [Patescibacteria group bacterium]
MNMLAGVKKAHLIGIGGIGVSAVAKLLWHAGIKVSGSDAVASGITSELIKRGMEISIGPAAGQLPDEVD